MKRMKRATACLVAASLLFTVLPLSGCFKKKHAPMGTNEVLTDDAPWYNIDKKILEKTYDPSEMEYSWSDLLGVFGDRIVMRTEGSYPVPDEAWEDGTYMNYNVDQLDIYSMDGELVCTVDLRGTINGSDIFDSIDPEELEEDFNFSGSGFGVGLAGVPSKNDPEEGEDESEDESEPEDIADEDEEDGEAESDLIDPREYWYLENLTMDGDAIVASVYCYVGPGHYYEFTIDPSTGDLISAEETSQSADDELLSEGSSEGTTIVNGYSIEKFWIYDWEGDGDPSYMFRITAPDNTSTIMDLRDEMSDMAIYDIPTFIAIDEDKVIFPMSIQGESEDKYGILDLGAMTDEEYTEDMDWLTEDLWSLTYIDGIGNVVMSDDGLTLLDFDSKSETLLFDYNWCNINRYDIQSLRVISYSEDEVVLAGSVWRGGYMYSGNANDDEMQIITLTKADSNPNSGKTVLVASTTGYLSYTMCEAVCKYNEDSSDYFITIDNSYSMENFMDYSNIEDDEQFDTDMLAASSELTDQLAIDLMAGEGPDIILDATSFYQLNNEDYLLDLSDRIPAEGYFNNVFEASKIDDKLYQIPLTFAMNGIITRECYVDDDQTGFTFDQYAEFVDEVCNGTDPMYMSTQLGFFVECFTAMNDQFISNGKVDYDNDAFRALAEFVRDNVTDAPEEDMDIYSSGVMYTEEEERPAEYYTYASFKAMIDSFAKYDDTTILGIPSYDGRGPLITVDSSVAISAQTQEADACWAFVELLLSEDFQTMYGESDYCTPVNVNAFVNTGHAAIDDYNTYVQEQLRWATPEDIQMWGLYELDYSCIDKFQDLIESCSQVASQDSAVVTIVREEMPAYFSGQKDIEDVISIMEDRVQTFLDERG